MATNSSLLEKTAVSTAVTATSKATKLEVVLETVAAYEHDRQDLLDPSEKPKELI